MEVWDNLKTIFKKITPQSLPVIRELLNEARANIARNVEMGHIKSTIYAKKSAGTTDYQNQYEGKYLKNNSLCCFSARQVKKWKSEKGEHLTEVSIKYLPLPLYIAAIFLPWSWHILGLTLFRSTPPYTKYKSSSFVHFPSLLAWRICRRTKNIVKIELYYSVNLAFGISGLFYSSRSESGLKLYFL